MARILTLTSWYPPHHFGGYELSCFDVMTRLVERGHEVRVLCGDERVPGARPADPEHEALVDRELRPHLRESTRRKPSLRELIRIERANRRTLERHLREFEPDVVSVWHMVAISMTLLRQLETADVPVLYAVCDEWPRYGTRIDPWTSRFDGGVLRAAAGRAVEALTGLAPHAGAFGDRGTFCFVSDATRRRLERETNWAYPCSTVVYSGIESAAFRPRDEPPCRNRDLRLLYVGRFDAWKGIDTLLKALPLLPDASLDCYGRGAEGERRRLERLARDLDVSPRVRFGSLERDEIGDRYRNADIVVFPSEWHEPFGLVPLEAMACGTPVVATGVGGSAEFLRDGGNCTLFAPGDPVSLAAAVHRVRGDAALQERMIAGGLQTAAVLDVDRLADVFDAWHVATALRFAEGRPPDRRLSLPEPTAAVSARDGDA